MIDIEFDPTLGPHAPGAGPPDAATVAKVPSPVPGRSSSRASRVRIRDILRSCWGLLLRDLVVLRRNVGEFLIRTLAQPVLFVFVFVYLFPRIGQQVGGASYGAVLLPGLVAVSAVFCGVSSVSLPLAIEFGATREIEDRALAPVPLWAIGTEKILFGAAQSLVAAAIVLPLGALIGATPISFPAEQAGRAFVVLLVACWTSGALGLLVGTVVPPQRMGLVFSVLVVPLSFLGCAYYPWAALRPVPWLAVGVLANPVTYLSEGLRASLTPSVPHLDASIYLGVSLAFAVVLTVAGGWLFARRVTRL